jgi:hypothetical protein
MRVTFFVLVLLFGNHLLAQIQVDDFIRANEKDHAIGINRAMVHIDSIGHGSLEFTGTKTYQIKSAIQLPRYQTKGRRIFILNGNGCKFLCHSDTVDVFKRLPKTQKEALNLMMATRFSFRDFTIRGGRKGINLGASYGSSILRCNFWGQKKAAIDIQFGLNTHIHHCNSTSAVEDNFILRTGADWGGSNRNSQSNHSVISMCRVYASKGAKTAFKVLGSNGVVLKDIISEGQHDIDYSVYYNSLGSPNVKLFQVSNFHLEHRPLKAGVFINGGGHAVLEGIYYQHAYKGYHFIEVGMRLSKVSIKNIPWFVTHSGIYYQNSSTEWLIEDCHKRFYSKSIWFKESIDHVKQKSPSRKKLRKN